MPWRVVVVVVVVVVTNVVPVGAVTPGSDGTPGRLGFGTCTGGSFGRFTPGRSGSGTRVLTMNGVGRPIVTVVCWLSYVTTWFCGSAVIAWLVAAPSAAPAGELPGTVAR